MKKTKIITTFFFVIISMIFISDSYAIPSLQLYIPGSDYVDEGSCPWSCESWYTPNSQFDIQVMAVEKFASATLVVAAKQGETGTVTINGSTYGIDAFTYGTPIMGYKNGKPHYMGSHGIYDTSYLLYDLGSIMTLDVPVYNEVDRYYESGDLDPKTGAIIELSFSKSGFDMIHFDVFGTDLSGKIEFAPFSHDAEDGPVRTPEPASAALILIGLAGSLAHKHSNGKNK